MRARQIACLPRLALLAGLACAGPGAACAQDVPVAGPPASTDVTAPAPDPGTGDALSDRRLADIDLYAARHRDAFVDELVRYFDAPRALVEGLLAQPAWRAGELYYACAVARAAGRPCRAVAELRERQRDLGWQAIAAQVGIQAGSAQEQRIGDGFADSYRRWARPLPLAGDGAPSGPSPKRTR